MTDSYCPDCGGFDIEWMYKCEKHGIEYCRGCSCPYCAEDDDIDYDDNWFAPDASGMVGDD